jgi:hypothetical protein
MYDVMYSVCVATHVSTRRVVAVRRTQNARGVAFRRRSRSSGSSQVAGTCCPLLATASQGDRPTPMTPRAILIRATRSAVLPWLAAFRVRVVTHARDPNGKLYTRSLRNQGKLVLRSRRRAPAGAHAARASLSIARPLPPWGRVGVELHCIGHWEIELVLLCTNDTN